MRPAPGKGRGVFASAPLPAGALVYACRAVATQPHPTAPGSRRAAAASPNTLVPAVVAALAARPALGERVWDLDAGPAFAGAPPAKAPAGWVDERRLAAIIRFNSFTTLAVTRTAAEARRSQAAEAAGSGLDDGGGEGLWLQPSRLNHSCCPSAAWRVVGDFMFVYAARAVAAGEELTVSYVNTATGITERSAALARRGFACACARCALARARPEVAAMEARAADLLTAARSAAGAPNPGRPAGQQGLPLPRPEVSDLLRSLRAQALGLPAPGRGVLAVVCDLAAWEAFASRGDFAAASAAYGQAAQAMRDTLGDPADEPRHTRAALMAALFSAAAGGGGDAHRVAQRWADTAASGACSPPWGTLSRKELRALLDFYVDLWCAAPPGSGEEQAQALLRELLQAAAARLVL